MNGHSQTQSPSIRTGVTFQWSDVQDTNGNGDVDNSENNRPATIESITVSGEQYNTFVVPSSYELTRLGPDGHTRNGIYENGNLLINSSGNNPDPNASVLWNDLAISAFQDKNLNHYFTANPNGQNFCNSFSNAASTNAQKQTIFYSPSIPSNEGAILAVTERGGNNCFYVEMYGTPAGGGAVQKLGETFVRSSGNYVGSSFGPPQNNNTDYWRSGREQDNGQNIAIALFNLNSIAPTGSKITRIEFVAATRDHGDGKFFILQQYAVDGTETGCLNTPYNGNIDLSNTAPDNSTYSLVANSLSLNPPSGNGNGSLIFNSNGTYTYTPPNEYVGEVTFNYRVTLPAPNQNISDTATITLSFVDPPTAPIVDIVCQVGNSSSLEVTAPLGSEFVYSINGDQPVADRIYQSNPLFSNVSSGSYVVSVKNRYTNCFSINSSTIIVENLNVSGVITDVKCKSGSTGSIDVTTSGGTEPYTFSWSTGQVTEDLTNVLAGEYTLTVTGAGGCVDKKVFNISEPIDPLSITVIPFHVKCQRNNTGAINLTVSGGTPSYSYDWSGPSGFTSSSEDITGIAAGTYTVIVTDANGCKLSRAIEITEPTNALSATATPTAVACNGDSTGSINLTVNGGTPSYTYDWSGPSSFTSTDEDLSNLAAGTYTVIVTDANGCKLSRAIEITEPSTAVTGTIISTNENGITANDGTATITGYGGVPEYTYLWSPNGETTATITGLDSGTYSVVIRDQNNCSHTESVTITSINQIPIPQDDNATTPEDTRLIIDVLLNDSFGRDGPSPSNIQITTLPVNGTTIINLDSTVEYVPDPNFVGIDEFIYQIQDNNGDTAFSKVLVTVTPVVDVVDDYETTTEDTAVTLNVLANDLFVGSNYEVTSVATPSNGTVTFTADGTMEYTPGPNFNGSDQFEYTVRLNM